MGRAAAVTCAILLLGVGAAVVRAIPVPPQPIPVSRLVSSLSARVQKNPGDVQAVYTLGRVHYFAFAGATDTVNVTMGSDPANPYLSDHIGETGKGRSAYEKPATPIAEATRLTHLKNAINSLHRAVAVKPRDADGRYELALACAYEEGAPFAAKVGVIDGTAATGRAWLDMAIRSYGHAFDQAVAADSKTKGMPP